MEDFKAIAELVQDWVAEAGEMLRESLHDDSIQVSQKTDPSDLVTEMDKKIEAFYVEKIKKHFPDHRIYGEEGTYDEIDDLKGFIWMIDPIDGTLNYVKQKSNFCSMIALFKEGEGKLSFINDVTMGKCYHGIKGEGVYCNGVPLEKIPDHPLREGLLALNTKMTMEPNAAVKEMMQQALGVRLIGSAGLEMIQVITNRTSAYLTTPLHAWDVAPGYMLAEEMGLICTQTDGKPIDLLQKNGILVANPVAHEEIRRKFNSQQQ